MALQFWKYQGLGNDFVVVEGPLVTAERARRLCDRRRGIGADGVLSVLPPRGADAAAYMHIHNSDGSVAAMCGNGVRCVARHLAETRGLSGELVVDSDAGPKRCRLEPDGTVTVEMGPARLEGEQDFTVGAEQLHALRVSMGNPHAVFFGEASVERARTHGPVIESMVPGGVNAGFAAVRGGSIDLVVWERGAGLTDACGTGACAAAVAAVSTRLVHAGVPIDVRLPGGTLVITVGADLSRVEMRGPAERVFAGTTDL